MEEHRQIPIWYFIGLILALYGAIILATGVYEVVRPPPPDERVHLWGLHAAIWWGAFLLAVGSFYVARFRPGRSGGS